MEAFRITTGLVFSIALLVIWPRFIKLNAFLALLVAALLFALIAGMPVAATIGAMQNGFGSLLQQIGIIVALGSVLGILLEKTGAMEVISATLLKLFGAHRPVLALAVIGTLVGIPVFCDSGFIILSRLIPSLALKTSTAQTSLTLALSSSLYTTHTLVPPTPGPLAAAANLGLSDQLGTSILFGLAASIPVVIVSYFYSKKIGPAIPNLLVPDAESVTHHTMKWHRAFLPLVLPILLIATGSFGMMVAPDQPVMKFLSILGIPLVALAIGVLLAMTLIDRVRHPEWRQWTTHALKDAGIILLIIGAGGAFGSVIKSSHLSQLITSMASDERLGGILFLLFAWLIGALLKTAQGSTTSAMIITSSLVAPLAASAGLHTTLELSVLVLAIGGGAMTVSHANDAYFWVVSEFGGVSSKDLFKSYTPMTLLQGVTALITSMIFFLLL